MSAVSNKRKIELLEQLLLMDVWNEFLLPEYKEASEILLLQLKQTKDTTEGTKLIGQLIGLDAIITLPILLNILKQAEAQAEEIGRAEPPSADPA